jgi:NDP-sugar pyrophosphorylase family protein
MKAMILAAGLGTRLRPLTDNRPKALVEIDGRTLLEITIARLRDFGVSEIIVNVHHFAEQVVEFLRAKKQLGVRIEVSREDECLLDTGGGLNKAAWFFLEDGRNTPFILHNVDVLSNIDLGRMVKVHTKHNALVTLAVQQRDSSRQLIFDTEMRLCGRRLRRDAPPVMVRKCAHPRQFAFTGIHVISPNMLKMITETGAFSIIDCYLRLASAGERIVGFAADEYYWRDLGSPENIAKAEEYLRSLKEQKSPTS